MSWGSGGAADKQSSEAEKMSGGDGGRGWERAS